jgi:hypothetical protein
MNWWEESRQYQGLGSYSLVDESPLRSHQNLYRSKRPFCFCMQQKQILLFANMYAPDNKDKKNPIVVAQLNMSDGTPCLFQSRYWASLPLQREQDL